MIEPIAIVGMACRYPDARSPIELWENALAQRRAFRRMPPERLRLADYYSSDRNTPDSIYSTEAALIENSDFDRVRYRIAGTTFRSADPTHWLALDIAAQAIADAGFVEGSELQQEMTGVFVGNTLTGEFARASLMRLRWPFVRRMVDAALVQEGWSIPQRHDFISKLEVAYKEPFAPVGEETLAGGLSNTIAGRICNHFDLKGGGYTIDGACAASLLAVANACSALAAGDLDVAIAGGVDLSMDPFELVGFAKTGALAQDKMRVYDMRSAGFWPGEGCGFVVLMRNEDALEQCRRIYAVIRGWGISSDGSGGITRPEVEGQLLALRRAYKKAGYGVDTVSYFEGHGTGTAVGDATELKTLTRARREAAPDAPRAVISSIKALIGHTKAAAGIAGMIKATMAVHTQVLPPTPGCEHPHTEIQGEQAALRVLSKGELWPADLPLRASVSAMGFGGINTHITMEGVVATRRRTISGRERALLSAAQDAEILFLSAQTRGELLNKIDSLLAFAASISISELTDLAAELARGRNDSDSSHKVRAAIIAANATELAERLGKLKSWIEAGEAKSINPAEGICFAESRRAPRIGFLFPGQGSPAHTDGGLLRRRFDFINELYELAHLPSSGDSIATAIAQPAIVTATMAGLRALNALGINAEVGVGHSLGELSSLHWGGAIDEAGLLRIAMARGKAMTELGDPTGTMASVKAGKQEVEALLNGNNVVIAGLNSPSQTVISGTANDVADFLLRARTNKVSAVKLPVSHAFHSPLVAAAAPALAAELAHEVFNPLGREVISTVTGETLQPEENLQGLLYRQVTSPVLFFDAVTHAAHGLDLLIEVGPGQVLKGLVEEFLSLPVISLNVGDGSIKGLLQATAAAFVLGAEINHQVLFNQRFTRPFNLNWQPRFFVNPCERAPVPDHEADFAAFRAREIPQEVETVENRIETMSVVEGNSLLEVVRQMVAQRAELPPSAVKDDNRLLGDLHLNSIAVSQLVAEAARNLGLPPPIVPTDYSNVTVAEVGQALEDLSKTGGTVDETETQIAGVDSWVRAFTVDLIEQPLPSHAAPVGSGAWQIISPADYPLRNAIQEAFKNWGEGGVIVCLPTDADERHVGTLLMGAQAALAEQPAKHFVLVQHGGGAAGFARTLHLETPEIATTVVDVPLDQPGAVDWILAEVAATTGYSEAHYDSSGTRRTPRLRVLPDAEESDSLPLSSSDVLLVTGGGKGIAAECALTLAWESGVRLVLFGRSNPATDSELAGNLERMEIAGARFKYYSVDVADAVGVSKAISEAEKELGPITAILHAAGTNAPQSLHSLDEQAFQQTLRPKVQGLRNVLAAIQPDRLRLLITFGSIIARMGMRGEADYSVANEWLVRLTEKWQAEHPLCRCLAVEYSVWSGVGMGQRLGGIDALVRQGVTPITPDQGIDFLRRLLKQNLPTLAVTVTGRFGDAPTLQFEQPELPLMRFLERVKVHYPGVELIVEADLSADTDPYLDDHVFQGERVFPGVMGLEAMAQVAMALSGETGRPTFEEVKFNRPVVVPEGATVTIRLAAILKAPGLVEIALRSQETAFQVDHFRATCYLDSTPSNPECAATSLAFQDAGAACVPLDLDTDLYGGILFHSGRFRRLRGYQHLRAKACTAEISPDGTTQWFARYLPAKLVMGDPGAFDATIHAIQACIPQTTLLPVGVDKLVCSAEKSTGPWFVRAVERFRDGDHFTYDIEMMGAQGVVESRWEGLHLRMVGQKMVRPSWALPLLSNYCERRIQELIPCADLAILIERNGEAERPARTDRAIQRTLGSDKLIQRRPDGKPQAVLCEEIEVSAAHAGDLTLAIAGTGQLGCDIELVLERPAQVWRDILGADRFDLAQLIARETREDFSTAATRVWTATESMKKAGLMIGAPLVFNSLDQDGWVLLESGALVVATFVGQVREIGDRLAIAVLAKPDTRY